jgi:hypothetical protein
MLKKSLDFRGRDVYIKSMDRKEINEAYREALRRYPESASGLAFFYAAAGFAERKPSEKAIAWAKKKIEEIKS